MSSAKREKPSLEEQEQISLMFKRKSSGPSTEPRGTPQTMLEESEVWDYPHSFFIRMFSCFTAKAEYPYFPANFRLKIFLYSVLNYGS